MKKENKTFMILGVISALTLLLIAGCQNQPKPIGGDKDNHGCLIGAGYSWDDNIGACTRSWELDESQAKAAGIAVKKASFEQITILDVETLRCPGCFKIRLQSGEGEIYTFSMNNWEIITDDCGECPQYSPPSPEFCKDGVLIDQGKDECGCQLPPGCEIASEEDEKPVIGMPNPASQFCVNNGGTLEIVTVEDGSQSGICTLANGVTKCDEWAYFRGECPEEKEPELGRIYCTDEQKAAEICTMEYMPVCGDDGNTYGNKCSACASKKIDYYIQGECFEEEEELLKNYCTEPRPEICTKEYMPVCGWFDESIQCIKYPCAATYGNKCTACTDAKVAYWTEGECPDELEKAI